MQSEEKYFMLRESSSTLHKMEEGRKVKNGCVHFTDFNSLYSTCGSLFRMEQLIHFDFFLIRDLNPISSGWLELLFRHFNEVTNYVNWKGTYVVNVMGNYSDKLKNLRMVEKTRKKFHFSFEIRSQVKKILHGKFNFNPTSQTVKTPGQADESCNSWIWSSRYCDLLLKSHH